ncbi:MAG: aminopeptidase [Phycisphaerae bacterium]|nr:aminopeptidase [Phycisphaerae bacterium]
MQNPIQAGARQAVTRCVRVQPNERVVIITDQETLHLAKALETEVSMAHAYGSLFIMEDFGPRNTSVPLPFPAPIAEALTEAQASFYIAQCKTGELQSFRFPMCDVVNTYRVRHAHMPGFTEIMMSQGMAADYDAIARLSKTVFDCVTKAKTIRVTTPAGTDLTAEFDPAVRWVISDGRITGDNWKNLPDGEVFTAPKNAWGTVVVDGCLGDFFCDKYGLITDSPLTYAMDNGRCVPGSVQCRDTQLKQDFEAYTFDTDENARRLGEFAIGTNIGLKALIGNLLQDEKFPGIHLALGNPYPDKTGATWDSKAHCDGVLIKPTIHVENQIIMRDGEFCIDE